MRIDPTPRPVMAKSTSTMSRRFSRALLAATPVTLRADVRIIALRRAPRRVELRGGVLLFYSLSAPFDVHSASHVISLQPCDCVEHVHGNPAVARVAGRTLAFTSSDVATKFFIAVTEAVSHIAAANNAVPSLQLVGGLLNPSAAAAPLLSSASPTTLARAPGTASGLRVVAMDGASTPLLMKSVPKADALFTETDVRRTVDQRVSLERAAASASPFLVGLVLAFETEDTFNFVTHAPELGTLSRLLASTPHGRLPESVARSIFAELCLALRDVHRLGLLFRNLSTESIVFTVSGHVRLCSFDLAKPVAEPRSVYIDGDSDDGEDASLKERSVRVGRAQSFVGKRLYMSPEHLSAGPVGGGSYSAPVDYWALGITLYTMLTGWHPFAKQNDSTELLFERIDSAKIKFPSYVSEDARRLIKGLLDRDENSRFMLLDIKRSAWMDNVDWDAIEVRAFRQRPQKDVLRVVRAVGLQSIEDMVHRLSATDVAASVWRVSEPSFSTCEDRTVCVKAGSRVCSIRTGRAKRKSEASALLGFAFHANQRCCHTLAAR